jgi:hypothetical protein
MLWCVVTDIDTWICCVTLFATGVSAVIDLYLYKQEGQSRMKNSKERVLKTCAPL